MLPPPSYEEIFPAWRDFRRSGSSDSGSSQDSGSSHDGGSNIEDRHIGRSDNCGSGQTGSSESGSRCHESSQSRVNRGSCEGCGNVHRGMSRGLSGEMSRDVSGGVSGEVSREILPLRDDPCRTFFCRTARWGDEVGWPYN